MNKPTLTHRSWQNYAKFLGSCVIIFGTFAPLKYKARFHTPRKMYDNSRFCIEQLAMVIYSCISD